MRITVRGLVLGIVLLGVAVISNPARGENATYRTPGAIDQEIGSVAKQSKGMGRTTVLAQTPGGRDIVLLELGEKNSDAPAILVVANMEGDCPIASEAALRLARLLTGDWADDLSAHRWYIIANANPDGYARYFSRPQAETFVNERAFNDDKDDATDEDSPDDLNGDGYITMMRQKHPEGRWVPVEGNPVLMREADEGKGERGVYRLFPEGIDNDGDGSINEDGPGGVNPGHNFPHNFKHHTKTNGMWAASEAESRAVLRFAFDHPEIAMVLVLGRSNSLKAVPEGGRRAQAGQSKYKVPERWAKRFGLDPDKEYPVKELLDLARDAFSYPDLTEDQLLQWIGAGAAVNPDKNDVPYWKEISERYNDFIKEAGLDGERLDPPGFGSGTVQEWAYYQYGVPTFCMDFWSVPKTKKETDNGDADSTSDALTPDDIEKMSNEEFINLGEDKINELIKESGAPPQLTAERVIQGLESGHMTTKRIAGFLRKAGEKDDEPGADADEQALYDYDSAAYVVWAPYTHPTLGAVDIGGKIPYRDLVPPAADADSLIDKQLPFLRDLAKLLPDIGIADVTVESRGANVWKVEAWVTNTGFLPYPTHQGARCERPAPTIVSLEGDGFDLLEGELRQSVGLLSGSGGVTKLSWLIRAPADTKLTLFARAVSARGERKHVTLTGGGQ